MTKIPTSQVAQFVALGRFPDSGAGSGLVDFKNTSYSGTTGGAPNVWEEAGSVAKADEYYAGKGTETEITAEDAGARGMGQTLKTYCFFLGDLLDVISDCIYEMPGDYIMRPAYQDMNLGFMASTFSLPNLTGKNEIDDITRNILTVPIELDFFVKWFNDSVINKDLIYYPIGTMIKDLVERLISSLLFETCFSSPGDLPPLFRTMYVTDCSKPEKTRDWRDAFKKQHDPRQGPGPSQTKLAKGFYYDVERYIRDHPNYPFIRQNSNMATSDRRNYCIIYCMRPMILNRKSKYNILNDKDSFKKYVPVINYGIQNTNANYLSDVKFSKTNSPGLRESRYFSNMNGSLSLLSNVYDLSFSFKNRAGNTLFYPGQMFDFRLIDKGLGSPHDPRSDAFHLGFGGYHIVKSVTYNLTQLGTDFTINVDSKFLDTKAPKEIHRASTDKNKSPGEKTAVCAQEIDKAERIYQAELSDDPAAVAKAYKLLQ